MSKISRREKRSLIVLLILSAVPLGVAGLLAHFYADPNIQLPARAAPPAPNGFDLYVQAATQTGQPVPAIDASSDPDVNSISAAQAATRYSRARREAWHSGAAKGWATFRRAQRTPTRDPYAFGAERMPGYARLRELGRNKAAEMRLFALRGDDEKAVASALDCVEMAYDTSREGALISRLVASAICALGVAPLSEAQGQNTLAPPEKLSAAQALAAAARLESLRARQPSYIKAVENTRWDGLAALDRAFKRGNWRARETFDVSGRALEAEAFSTHFTRSFINKRTVVDNVNAIFDATLARLQAPYQSAPAPDKLELDPISAAFDIDGIRQRFNMARENTQLDLLLLRLALRAYKSEKGVYPTNLAMLKQGYLKQIPTDEFGGGRPYFYTVKDGKYRLWSVGPDGVNDGGKAIQSAPPPGTTRPWHKRSARVWQDSKGDVVAGETL